MGSPGTGPAARDDAERDAGHREFVRAVPRLGGMVASAVGYRSSGLTPAVHRGLPSPWLTLIFSLDGPVVGGRSAAEAHGEDAVAAGIVLGGLHQSPAYVLRPERESGLQLGVHPLAARALFKMPAAALAPQLITEGAEALGRPAARIRERLRDCDGWPGRFAILGDWLRALAADAEHRPGVRPEIAEAWAWLERRRGAGTLDGLATHVALSPRRLTTLFRAETGVTPKQAARLMRFERARSAVAREAAAGRRPALARVAADCGYFDHSHLVRDFRQYTGVSPSAWLAEECRNIQAGSASPAESGCHGQHRDDTPGPERLAHPPGP